MSRYYASISGSGKTEATRRGFKSIESHTRSWTQGVKVYMEPSATNPDEDIIEIYLTGGSKGDTPSKLLGRVIKGKWVPQ